MNIVEEVRQILIAARPANADCANCRGELRPATAAQVDALIAELEAFRPVARTWERPAQTVILRPAAYQRARAGCRPL